MKRFESELDAINSAITDFNEYLSPKYHIPLFDHASMFGRRMVVEIMHGNWHAFPYPNNGAAGVYFIFGHEKVLADKNGLYIGKASLRSTTSNRLYKHLSPGRSKEQFLMPCRGESYVLDYIASIDLSRLAMTVMAPALEEHLIIRLAPYFNLLNGIGNRNG